MTSDERREEQVVSAAAEPAARAAGRRISGRVLWAVAIGLVLLLDVAAFLVAPPFPKDVPGAAATYPADYITANMENLAPSVVVDMAPGQNVPFWHLSITSTILTSWIVIALLLAGAFLTTRRLDLTPGRLQNAIEYVFESLSNFAYSLGGPPARRYVPLFSALFLYILACNWSGLIPPIGKVEFLRAPTSDVNITIGLALVSFVIFHVEGVRSLGIRGYLGKYFSLAPFREGISAGLIGLFVGVMEFMLEFTKPVTLAMRLFGNIFGGELALGVITALTIAAIPVALVSLELLLNFVQALIFSVLTLIFTLMAIEGHEEAHVAPAEASAGRAPALLSSSERTRSEAA